MKSSGTNNAFEGLKKSDLSKVFFLNLPICFFAYTYVSVQLYSTSTMERHHLDMCIMILNSNGNTLLSGLSPADYEETMTILKKAILATDISTYLKIRTSYIVCACVIYLFIYLLFF